MCSTRKFSDFALLALVLMTALLAGGCESINESRPEPLNMSPLVIDQAMVIRDWPRSAAVYENGSVIAGPTGYPYRPVWDMSDPARVIVEPGLFIGQTVLLPVTFILTPPWSAVTYHGVQVPPTHTASPPL